MRSFTTGDLRIRIPFFGEGLENETVCNAMTTVPVPKFALRCPPCCIRLTLKDRAIGLSDLAVESLWKYVGTGRVESRMQAATTQLGTYDLAVSPAGTAPEVLNVVFCHVVSLINATPFR